MIISTDLMGYINDKSSNLTSFSTGITIKVEISNINIDEIEICPA